jgi:hypothetical protein
MQLLILFGLIGMLGGVVLTLRGMWLRKPDHPSLEMGQTKLKYLMCLRPWRYKEYWEGNGYKYDFIGRVVFTLGCLCGTLYYLV